MNTRTFASLAVIVAAAMLCGRAVIAQETDAAHPPGVEHADAHGTAAQTADPNPMAFGPDLAIFSAVVFLLLLAILGKFAWPQIVAALDERERKIADNIAAAEARHEEAKQLLAAHEARLAAAAGEVRELLEEARRDADHTRKSIEAKGHQAAQDELTRALREIQRAKDGAIQDLAEASANVAIDLARKVVGEQLTPQKQSQLVREALGKLTAAAPSEN